MENEYSVIVTLMAFQDRVDGEFAVTKTAINQHIQRSDSSAESHHEIKDSKSVVEFGQKHLSKPGKKAGMDERCFVDLRPEDVLKRKEEVSEKPEEGKTIAGISNKFEYICKVKKYNDII